MARNKVAGIPGVDPTLPLTSIELGGVTYNLVFTFKALAIGASELRKQGVNVNLLHSLDLTSMDADRVAPLLFAAMITHHPEMQVEKVQDLITLKNLGRVFEAIAQAYTDSMVEPSTSTGETTGPKA
jgi:hypothetical protein